MEKVEINVLHDSAATIHIQHPESSYGIFCYNSRGDLFCNSDWGSFSFAWRHTGEKSFRDFLAQTNADYIVGKFGINYLELTSKRMAPHKVKHLTILTDAFISALREQRDHDRAVAPKESPSDVFARRLLEERKRQIEIEGYDPKNDLQYFGGELAQAAAVYATPDEDRRQTAGMPDQWPEAFEDWMYKPWDINDDPDPWKGRMRELEKAGALILAEMERCDTMAGYIFFHNETPIESSAVVLMYDNGNEVVISAFDTSWFNSIDEELRPVAWKYEND